MSVLGMEPDGERRAADLRLLVPALTAWAVCYWTTLVPASAAGIACAVGIVACLLAATLRSRAVAMGCAAMVAAAASGGLHVAALGSGPLPVAARLQKRVEVIVRVSTDPVVHKGAAAGSQLQPDLVLLRGRGDNVGLATFGDGTAQPRADPRQQ